MADTHPIAAQAIRTRLGIPDDAERVLMFAETSHWDPNWLRTSEEYFATRVRHTLDAALRVLQAEPTRIYAIESVFFLRMYWEREPARQSELRELLNGGRLKLTGTAMTTPDTTLPAEEAILRDYLAGRTWLRERGITAEPKLAYLPDNFGHSPGLPALLRAMGLPFAAVSRIDGMHFPGDDWRGAGWYPRPGSSAKLLQDAGTADFTWRAPDGSEVLCHWNAFTYFQGDMLAWRGIMRWMNRAFGWQDRSPGHIRQKIRGYVRQLQPLAKTPYMLCPIGCDFNDPIEELTSLLARYNEAEFRRGGVFAVSGSLEDYLELVSLYPERFPTLELDPNPYWMGFYASRPQLKQRCRALTSRLLCAEKLIESAEREPSQHGEAQALLKRAWDRVVVSNHHDFITGTAPRRVHDGEQETWLAEAEEAAGAALDLAERSRPARVPPAQPGPPEHSLQDGVLVVRTPHYQIRIEENAGGCITEWTVPGEARNLVRSPSNDLVAYRDSGGLWRMGHEFRGGVFRVKDRASGRPATIGVEERPGALLVTVRSLLDGKPVQRVLTMTSDSAIVAMQVQGAAGRRRTVTCRFHPAVRPDGIAMDVPGSVVTRAFGKGLAPTFWSAANFVHVRDREDDHGMAAWLGGPGCVTADTHGAIEWVVMRNAPRELAWGVLPVLAHPAWGANDDEHGTSYAVAFTPSGDWKQNRLPMLADQVLGMDGAADAVGAFVQAPDDVVVRSLKRAEDGRGRILRLRAYDGAPIPLRFRAPVRVVQCDALERDVQALQVEEGTCVVPGGCGLVSVRVMVWHTAGDD